MFDIMRHCGVKGNLTDKSQSLEIEDKFDIFVDANDHILERAVRKFFEKIYIIQFEKIEKNILLTTNIFLLISYLCNVI